MSRAWTDEAVEHISSILLSIKGLIRVEVHPEDGGLVTPHEVEQAWMAVQAGFCDKFKDKPKPKKKREVEPANYLKTPYCRCVPTDGIRSPVIMQQVCTGIDEDHLDSVSTTVYKAVYWCPECGALIEQTWCDRWEKMDIQRPSKEVQRGKEEHTPPAQSSGSSQGEGVGVRSGGDGEPTKEGAPSVHESPVESAGRHPRRFGDCPPDAKQDGSKEAEV